MEIKELTHLVALKNNARLDIVKSEYTNCIDLQSGNKSPNIKWYSYDENISLSSGEVTNKFMNNLELVDYLKTQFFNKTLKYLSGHLSVLGWQVTEY